MLTADFDYALPPELIAQTPSPNRGDSRLLVIRRDDTPPLDYLPDDCRCFATEAELDALLRLARHNLRDYASLDYARPRQATLGP